MRRFLLAILPLTLLIAGCAKPASPFIGKWKFADVPPKTGDAKQDAQTSSEADKFIFEIKDDKTWNATPPTGAPVNGTYTDNGKSLTLMQANPKTDEEKKPATCTLSDDGKTLIFSPPEGSIVLKFSKIPS